MSDVSVTVILILVTTSAVVIGLICMNLSADLACRKLLRMDIPVHGIGRQRGHDCCEIAWRYVLGRGSYHF